VVGLEAVVRSLALQLQLETRSWALRSPKHLAHQVVTTKAVEATTAAALPGMGAMNKKRRLLPAGSIFKKASSAALLLVSCNANVF